MKGKALLGRLEGPRYPAPFGAGKVGDCHNHLFWLYLAGADAAWASHSSKPGEPERRLEGSASVGRHVEKCGNRCSCRGKAVEQLTVFWDRQVGRIGTKGAAMIPLIRRRIKDGEGHPEQPTDEGPGWFIRSFARHPEGFAEDLPRILGKVGHLPGE